MSDTTINPTIAEDEKEEFLPMVDVDHDETHFVEEVEEPKEITLQDIVRQLVETMGNEITAYGIHSLVNATFKAKGVEKEIRPQMMYNYARNGMIVKGFKGTRLYTQVEAYEFVVKYTAKRI